MAVRHWAKVQQLADSSCGISSYAMTWMVLFFLMYRQPQVIPKVWDLMSCVEGVSAIEVDTWKMLDVPFNSQLSPSVQVESPVDLLRKFFDFYAKEVDWRSTALLTSNATFIPVESVSDQYPQCQVGFMTMLDPFDLSHNILQRVNEISKFKFIEEVKRAAKQSHQWPSLSLDSVGKPWGIAALFLPSWPDNAVLESQKPPKKSQKRKASASIDQRAGHSDYVINFTSERPGNLEDQNTWYALVNNMLVNILQNVFMTEVKQESRYYLPCDKENDIEIKDETQQNAFEAQGTWRTGLKIGADMKDSDHLLPMETSSDESLVGLKAGCSRTTTDTAKFHMLQSPPRIEGDSVSPCGELKSLQARASEPLSSDCTGKSVKKGMKDATVMNSDIGSSQPVASQVKRSTVDSCLDHSSGSDSNIHEYSPSQGEGSQVVSSESVSTMTRLLRYNEDKVGDKAENGKSLSDTFNLKSEQVSEVKSFDPPVPVEFQNDLVMEVSPKCLPSLPQSSAKPEGFNSVCTYSCSCPFPVWHGRNKVKSLVIKTDKKDLQGLALEREVSRQLIKSTCESFEASSNTLVDEDSERRKKRALLRFLKRTDGTYQEANHTHAGLSYSDTESVSNETRTSTSSPLDGETSQFSCEPLQFSCEIIQKHVPRFGNGVVQLRFYPLSQNENIFKNFFSCAASMMTRLVTKNLQTLLDVCEFMN